MSIDGIGGPKGPGGIKGPKGVGPTEAVEKPELAKETFTVDDVQSSAPPADARGVGDANIVDAVRDVAAEVNAGRIADLDSAFKAVVDRIVEMRYPAVPPRDRRRLGRSILQIMQNDPGVGAALREMLEKAVHSVE